MDNLLFQHLVTLRVNKAKESFACLDNGISETVNIGNNTVATYLKLIY